MRPGMRFGLSAIAKREIWRRWKAGQSLHAIGRAFDKPHPLVRLRECSLIGDGQAEGLRLFDIRGGGSGRKRKRVRTCRCDESFRWATATATTTA